MDGIVERYKSGQRYQMIATQAWYIPSASQHLPIPHRRHQFWCLRIPQHYKYIRIRSNKMHLNSYGHGSSLGVHDESNNES